MQRSVNIDSSCDLHDTGELLNGDVAIDPSGGTSRQTLKGRLGAIVCSLRACSRLLLLIVTTLACLWSLRLATFGQGSRTAREDLAHLAAKRWAARMLRLLGIELSVRGQPPTKQALIVGNHRSYVDVAALLSQVRCVFLAKAEVESWPIFGAATQSQRAIFVDRNSPESRALARSEAKKLLKAGVTLAAFPEGTTGYGPGSLPFKPGLFKEAEELGIPVVPMSIEYADREDAWVEDTSFVTHFLCCFGKARTRVVLSFGEPLVASEPRQLKDLAAAWVAKSLRTVNAELFP
jgi:1-acyl-sn-glycerol-3-phosphate acyltransferase